MKDDYDEGVLLIVDDSEDDYDIMKAALHKCDFSLKSHRRCKNGQDALDYLEKRGDYAEEGAAPTPSLILLDLNMPCMDGREALRRIKSNAMLRNIPVVVMTNSDNEQDVGYCYDHGANSYVRKSLDWKGFVKVIATTLAFWMGAAMVAAPASAADTASFNQAPSYSVLAEGGVVHAPRGFTQMCESRPELCPTENTNSDIEGMSQILESMYGAGAMAIDVPTLTKERWERLNQINTAVNTTIQPRNDRGPDSWDLGVDAGDCEDYVLMKRELLAKTGWPRSALRIAVVHNGVEYHAVLVASTEQGEFVLDNMAENITRVEDSPYEFVVAQSAEQAGEWVRVARS